MKQNIYVMGDIHGDWRPIRNFYQRNPKIVKAAAAGEENVLILLGDAGLNFFFNHRDEKTKEKLGKYPFIYFLIRGNHEQRPSLCANDNPDDWDVEKFFGNYVWVEKKYPYIKYAMDYVDFYYIPNEKTTYKTLVVPGAYSVDKYHRLKLGWSFFPDEQLSEQEKEAGLRLLNKHNWKCDLVLSHTCPVSYEPTDLFLPIVDQSMVDKSMERYLEKIERKLDYKLYLFGHYHDTRVYPKNGNKQIIMLFNNKAIDLKECMSNNINFI